MGHRNRNGREGLGFGLLLMSLGVLFLLDHFDVVNLRDFWKWWPLWTMGWGFVQVVGWQSAERVGSGVMLMLMGVWFMFAQMEWFGMQWHNSWPLAFVAIGAGMVVRSMISPMFYASAGTPPADGGSNNG